MKKISSTAMQIMTDYFGPFENKIPVEFESSEKGVMDDMRSAQLLMIESHQDNFIKSEQYTASWVIPQIEAMQPINT